MQRTNCGRVLWLIILLTALLPTFSFAAEPTTRPVNGAIRVAIFRDTGAGEKGLDNVANCLVKASGEFSYVAITAEEIRDGKLKDFDVLVQPGGSGSKQAKELEEAGCEKIKSFVKGGGGYVGICAGAYLASSDYDWSLHILNAKVVDRKHWARGKGSVQIRFTPQAKELLGIEKETSPVEYAQGPLLAPDDEKDLPAYQPLATFETEMAEKGAPTGVMKGTTAIACAPYFDGRVMAISPHPERSEGLDGLIRRAVKWVSKRESK